MPTESLWSCSHQLRSVFGHVDFLGKGATTLVEEVCVDVLIGLNYLNLL
jgi:hypothetical protein